MREGEVEEVGGVLESEAVLEAEGAEALGEVAFRHENETEEGAGVVGGELCKGVGCPSAPLGISASLRERAKIMKEKGRIGVEDFIDKVEGVSLAVDGLSGLVGWEEELGETVGDAGGKVPPSYALRATDGRWPSYALRATDGRWPSYALRATDGRWPSYALRATDGRWPSYALRATDGR